jgi:hypothetical protein
MKCFFLPASSTQNVGVVFIKRYPQDAPNTFTKKKHNINREGTGQVKFIDTSLERIQNPQNVVQDV